MAYPFLTLLLCCLIFKIEASLCDINCQITSHCPVIFKNCLDNEICTNSFECFKKCSENNTKCKRSCWNEASEAEQFMGFQLCLADLYESTLSANNIELRLCGDCEADQSDYHTYQEGAEALSCMNQWVQDPVNDTTDKKFLGAANCIHKYNQVKLFRKLFYCRAGCILSNIMADISSGKDLLTILNLKPQPKYTDL